MSPYEAHRGKLPSLKNFSRAVWGCDCVIMLPNPDKKATKLSPTGVKANYLGAAMFDVTASTTSSLH